MSMGSLSFDELQQAINDAALAKSKFYENMERVILQAIARQKPMIKDDGTVIKDKNGNIMYEENTTDDMISAIFIISMHGDKIETIDDRFIKRIETASMYARVLEKYNSTESFTRLLKEYIRNDIAIVLKNIIPDMTRVQTPVFSKPNKEADDIFNSTSVGRSSTLSSRIGSGKKV